MTTQDERLDEVERIYSYVDELLRSGEFKVVDIMLDGIDVDRGGVTSLLAWASITTAAKHELKKRDAYMKRLRARLERDDPARVEALLDGFE
jgi:hypothetical protein